METGLARRKNTMDFGGHNTMMLVVMTVKMTIMTQMIAEVAAHGRLMDPPARNSMWRLGFNNPVNYNDNELYCGGRMVRYNHSQMLCRSLVCFVTVFVCAHINLTNN